MRIRIISKKLLPASLIDLSSTGLWNRGQFKAASSRIGGFFYFIGKVAGGNREGN